MPILCFYTRVTYKWTVAAPHTSFSAINSLRSKQKANLGLLYFEILQAFYSNDE